jgi:hypothetical protein
MVSLHGSSTITTFLHENLKDVVASISLLCPAGIYNDTVPCAFWATTVSPPNDSSNAVEFSPGQRIFHDTGPEHVAMSARLFAALDIYDFTSDWELRDFSLIADLPAPCSWAHCCIGNHAAPPVVTGVLFPHDGPSTQWDSVVKVESCAHVVGIFPTYPCVCHMSTGPSSDGLIDSGANVGMSGDKSILVGVHDIEAIPLGLVLTPSNPLHIFYCTRMGYLLLPLADDDVLLVPTLVNPTSTETIISPKSIIKFSSNIVRWEQHGFRDGLPGQLRFFHSDDMLALELKLTCKEGLYYSWLSTVILDSYPIHIPKLRHSMGTASISCVCPKNDMGIKDWLSDGDILPSKPHTPHQLDHLVLSYLIPTPKSDPALLHPTTLAQQL